MKDYVKMIIYSNGVSYNVLLYISKEELNELFSNPLQELKSYIISYEPI